MPTPFRALEVVIKPEWLSANTSHLFVANYVMLFNDAARNFFAAHGLDQSYKDTQQQHFVFGGVTVRYEREIFGGDTALIDITLADLDDKRAHLALEMYRAGDSTRICFAEMLPVSASRATGRSAPGPAKSAQNYWPPKPHTMRWRGHADLASLPSVSSANKKGQGFALAFLR